MKVTVLPSRRAQAPLSAPEAVQRRAVAFFCSTPSKVTVKIAADFLKGKDAGNYGLQFEFASVAPRKVSLNVTDEAVEPSKPTTPAKPGANEQPKTEGVAKTGSSVPAVAAGTTMIVRKRATR